MSFSDEIKRFKMKTEKAATNIFRGTALSLFVKIVMRTPVATGRLRGNWLASINKAANKIDGNNSGYHGTVARAKLGDSIFLVNNLPYAGVIENGNSKQAPMGMVKVTVAEFQLVVRENARKARK